MSRYRSTRSAERGSSRRSTRRTNPVMRPFVAFLLISSFGILFAGCKGPEDVEPDEFSFTEDDVMRLRDLADEAQPDATGTGSAQDDPYIEPLPSGSGSMEGDLVLDLSNAPLFGSIRTGVAGNGKDLFRVSNEFLNIRSNPSVGAENVGQLNRGDLLEVLEFTDATWAKVRAVTGGAEGYVAQRYISKLVSEEMLAAEKAKYDGKYYVHFAFVNMRSEPNQSSEKIGEIPGQTIIDSAEITGDWAKVQYDGKDGYVSASYLTPFLPNFLVRQNSYTLPVLHYRLADSAALEAITQHVAALKADGYQPMSLREFYDLLLAQEQRDVRLDPRRFVVAVSDIDAANVRDVSDALYGAGIPATLFVEGKDLGLSGITEKMMITLLANGFDIQSATHTGDDLRALTNAQVELELRQSRSILESYTKRPVFAVSYPQGGVNDRVMQIASEAGYLMGISDTPERTFTRDQLLRLPSIVIFPTMTSDEVVKLVKGGS